MKTCAITLIKFSAFAATVLASPASLVQRQAITICNNGDAKCCDVDILGIAALDCIDPPTTPANTHDFAEICAAKGKVDRCCAFDLAGQGLSCDVPI